MKIRPLYRLAEGARFIVKHLPAWISYPIADRVGDTIFLVWPRVRRNMITALATLLHTDENDPEVKKTARRCTRNFSKYIVDLFRYAYPSRDFFKKNIKMSGMEHIEVARAEGKGIILVSFHLGNLDLGIRFLSSLGYPVHAIVDNLSSGQLDAFLQNPRKTGGTRLINVKEASTKLLDILHKNEILAMMVDNPNCMKGARVKLGERWVILPSGPATLSLRTGARLIPCGMVRTSNTTFKGIVGKPIEYQPCGKLSEDVPAITQRMAAALEEITRQFIDQWYVFHPLIKDELQTTDRVSLVH